MEVLAGKIKTLPSLLLESSIADSVVVRNTEGLPRLDKARRRGKIDVLQAAVHAVGSGYRYRNPAPEDQSDLLSYYSRGGADRAVRVV